jgi:hypothetical protein
MVFSKHSISSLFTGILVLAYAVDSTDAEISLPDRVCADYAVYAGGAITFSGTQTTGGDLYAEGAITGAYTMDEGQNAAPFNPNTVEVAHEEAMKNRAGERAIVAAMGGKTFPPGTMRSGTLSIAANQVVTLNGGADDIFIFVSGTTMTTGADSKIVLTGGAQAKNVLWALGGTFTSGADSILEGSIIAGGAVTVAAGNVVNGDVVSKGAITFGATCAIEGCVISIGAQTYGATSSVTLLKAATSAPTKSPTPEPTASPTVSPTVAPTTEPTASATAATLVVADVTPAPYCGSDVSLVRQIGGTSYTDKPISIISQTSPIGEVTFQISQEWIDTELSHLFVRFKDDELAYPNCQTFEQVNATWKSEPLTATCNKFSKIAIVEIWAADDSFMESDDAVLPECSCGAPSDLPQNMVKYVFQVECVSKCPESGCTASTGRMLGSELLGSEL